MSTLAIFEKQKKELLRQRSEIDRQITIIDRAISELGSEIPVLTTARIQGREDLSFQDWILNEMSDGSGYSSKMLWDKVNEQKRSWHKSTLASHLSRLKANGWLSHSAGLYKRIK